jgi:hypothetical protein
MEEHHQIPIWFFIGALLLLYGILITGGGLYHLAFPPVKPVALSELHADIWWGAVLIVLGAVYTFRFRPQAQ